MIVYTVDPLTGRNAAGEPPSPRLAEHRAFAANARMRDAGVRWIPPVGLVFVRGAAQHRAFAANARMRDAGVRFGAYSEVDEEEFYEALAGMADVLRSWADVGASTLRHTLPLPIVGSNAADVADEIARVGGES